MHQISEEDFQFLKDGCHHIMSIAMNYANPFVSDMEDWGSVHNDADLMLRVLEEVEEKYMPEYFTTEDRENAEQLIESYKQAIEALKKELVE